MNHAIEISNLSKRFSQFSLEQVSLTLPAGYIMGLIGPNGAGKTTIIKLILNLLRKEEGSIRVFGADNCACEREIKERIGVVLDQPFYVDDWRMTDVEKALAPFYSRWSSETFRSHLSQFAIDPKKRVKELSRGMKMKLMIAAALSHSADLLILDEPTSGLDAVARNDLLEILGSFLIDESKAILFSTHITADLEKIADYITFINDGRVAYSGTKDALLEKFLLVKGEANSLPPKQKRLIIGYREHGFGFDGLIDSSCLRSLAGTVEAEPCTLDEIVLRFNMRGESL